MRLSKPSRKKASLGIPSRHFLYGPGKRSAAAHIYTYLKPSCSHTTQPVHIHYCQGSCVVTAIMALRNAFGSVHFLTSGMRGSILQTRRVSSSVLMTDVSATGVAHLKSLCLSRLHTRESVEIENLRRACEEDGFFYLDLRHVKNGQMLRDWASVQPLMESWFARPLDEKMKYHCGTLLHG
jgi:hypothetical protein